MNFEVTDSAARRVLELITKETFPKVALRISVDGGGCSGFMYNYQLAEEISNDDFIVEKNGVKVIIDPISKQFLDKCRLEYIEELGSAFFQISNPSASTKCGCGNSFNV